MNNERRLELIENFKEYFREEIVQPHIMVACSRASNLSEYNVNPFLFKYLANFLTGNDDPISIAKALVLPRILGSSINTSFGMKVQSMISTLFEGYGSAIHGIDIEFIDAIDSRRKYCQLKAGPNTINHDDVTTIINHFNGIRNLGRTNNLRLEMKDLVVGVIYGEMNELSSHYNRINSQFPVIVGQEFWYRLTGKNDFYFDLINATAEIAIEVDATTVIQTTIETLAKQIEAKYFN
jgi:hypothetical protein